MLNKTRANIENRLSIKSLEDYVDNMIAKYCQDGNYPTLEYLCKVRKIKEIIVNNSLSNNAYIRKEDDYFILTTKKILDQTKPEDNYLFAHEIAHTFLYEIRSDRIFDTFNFTKSSLEQEYFCNFFARSLLIPTQLIMAEFANKESFISLKILNTLSKKYVVPYTELLKRILNDLELFKNIVIIRFVKFSNDTHWRLYESFSSESIKYNKIYFIPSHNYKLEIEYKKRFPSCDIRLSKFFDKKYCEINFKDEFSINDFETDVFETKPIKHLSKNFSENTIFKITKSYLKRYKSKHMNLLIQF